MTLYLYTKDTKNTSNCYDKCATNWPPLLTEGKPAAGTGADASLLGTTTRKDGKMQVTYNGWPLYYWVKDQKPGDATGQDVGGVWYVLNAKGEEVETPGGSSAARSRGWQDCQRLDQELQLRPTADRPGGHDGRVDERGQNGPHRHCGGQVVRLGQHGSGARRSASPSLRPAPSTTSARSTRT